METKRNIEAERELLLKLREAVNTKEEFEYVEAELAALAVLAPRQPVATVEQAIGLLRRRGLSVSGVAAGWIIHSGACDGYERELTCDSDQELIAYARDQHHFAVVGRALASANTRIPPSRQAKLAEWPYPSDSHNSIHQLKGGDR